MLAKIIFYYALVTFPERKHFEHTDIVFTSPFTIALTLLKFGLNVLDALLLTCERAMLILFPCAIDFSQISHFAITLHLLYALIELTIYKCNIKLDKIQVFLEFF